MFLKLKQFRLVIFGVFALLIFLMGHLLTTSVLTLAQTAPEPIQSPEQLVRQAAQLANIQEQFPQAIQRYSQALKLYHMAGDRLHESETRQALELSFKTAHPWAEEQDQQIQQELATFLKQFPKRDSNSTALQVEQLARSEFRLRLGSSLPLPALPPSEQQEWENLHHQLSDYFVSISSSRTDNLYTLPSDVVTYLKKQGAALTKIETLLQTQESPQWFIDLADIEQGDLNHSFPSFLGLVNLQDLILADAILKDNPTQKQERLNALEASWKLSQSLRDDPHLIPQLVSLISIRHNASVIRQLGVLPTEWQTRLMATDFRSSILNALTGESLGHYRFLSKLKFTDLQKFSDQTSSVSRATTAIGVDQWPETMQQSYLQWVTIHNYRQRQQLYRQLAQENVCTYDPIVEDALLQQLGIDAEDQDSFHNWINQWLKAGRTMLEMELTQKILQFKHDPLTKPLAMGSTSSVCHDRQWMYQTSVYGRTMIGIEPFPVWLGSNGLPPIYVIKSQTQ